MTLELLDGPFNHLDGRWQFEQTGESGCEVRLHIEFEFAGRVQDALLGATFEALCNELISAFVRRAP